jgi:regulator of cell morphogenesis and NO signaling
MNETMRNESAVMQMTVNETIRRFPATVEIFNRYGIDACCGGAAAVAEAAVRDGADLSALHADLLRAIGAAA